MMKKIFLVLVMLFSLFACSNESKDISEVTIAMIRVPNDETLAKAEGIFEKNFDELGIKVNYVYFDSGVQANQALASDAVDFATMGNTNSIVSLATDLDVKLVWIHEVLGTAEALVVKDDINSVEDLKGKVIATPFASTSHYILLNVLKEAGIENDVTLLNMKTAEIVAAWERGDIDAAYTWQPTLGQIATSGKILVTSEDMIKKGYITANVTVARSYICENNPEIVETYINSVDEAGDLYRNNPEQAIASVASELEISESDAKKFMSSSIWIDKNDLLSENYFGSNEKPGNFVNVMNDTAQFLSEQGSITNVPTFDQFNDFIDPTFIESVKD